MAKKHPGGRPTIFTPETIRRLKDAFLKGMNDTDACFYAGVGKSAFYDYQKAHPEFSDEKERLRANPVLKAYDAIYGAIVTGDVNTAKWLLERKRKDDFSTKSVIEPTAPIIRYVTAEDTKAVNEHIDGVLSDDGN